ncbi:MAG: DNA translocase FtsK [Armatimonadetes bacterium]|jgi:S-DNA-T family DNA segregation ATPase FtsK/SpoIIIE|nr:DNA translocase FtsK [Armatimonadota bacterium]
MATQTTPRKPRPPRSAAPRQTRTNTRFAYDTWGIALCAFGLILLATLFGAGSNSGDNFLGRTVVHGFYLLAGVGAWVFPFVLLALGGMLAIGKSRSYDNMGALGALYLIFIAWWHLGRVSGMKIDYHFVADNLVNGGGYIGAGISWLLRMLVGVFGAHVFFLALTGIGILFLVDVPLPSLLGPLERFVGEWTGKGRQAATAQAKEAVEKVRKKPVPGERKPLVQPPPSVYKRSTPEPLDDELDVDIEEPTAPARGQQPTLFSFRKEKPLTPTLASPLVEAEEKDDETAPVLPKPSLPRPMGAGGVAPFVLPSTGILAPSPPAPANIADGESEERRQIILQTLEDFGIGADVADVAYGPTITRYEIALERGIKVSKIVSLADNIAMALAAIDVRVEAPIPGKSAIGLEVPNEKPRAVSIRECLEAPEFQNAPGKLTFVLGRDVTGAVKVADLAKMPHLLIAGSTGSGKSVGLNALITSLLYRNSPRELKLLMIDPKKVELSLYEGIPHLASPVITNVKQAPSLFKQALREMETRYDKFAKLGTRNLEGYNAKVTEEERIPYWVIIVDELADLMMTSGPEIETSISRIAQLARATGIHLVIATQRPSVNVITGTIKANISSRIAFAMNSAVDSRTILDQTGADRLIGRGDMLFMPIDAGKPSRIQGCYVSEQDTETLVHYLKAQGTPNFDVLPSTLSMATGEDDSGELESDDDLFESAVRLVVSGGSASTSMLQRRFKIGYTRAARLVDLMEQRGIVGALDGAKPRDIMISRDDLDSMFGKTGVFET